MLRIKSFRNVVVGGAAMLFGAWLIQFLGLLVYWALPVAYSYVVSVWNSGPGQSAHIHYVAYNNGIINNFLVGFSVLFLGLLGFALITTLYRLLDIAGQSVVDAAMRRSTNDVA